MLPALSLQTWALIGTVAVAGVLVAGSRWQVAQAESKLSQCQSDNRTLTQAVERQNVRVETWEAAASQAQETSRAAMEAAKATTLAIQPELQRLRTLKPATCADAVQRVREGLR